MKNPGEPQDAIVRSEIDGIAEAVESFLSGAIRPEEFRRRRVVMGIYPIRGGADRYLVRVRIPLGRISPPQLRALAGTADRFSSGGGVHLTTRQDVHIYGIGMRQLPDALRSLWAAGLTTREACGDTVRNVVLCPFAGLSPGEVFDVTPYARAIGSYLLRHPLWQRLPRKFKTGFEGCRSGDHAGLPYQDAGVRAVVSPEGVPGFRVLAAGGLGALPHPGLTLEPFTPASRLWPTVTALLSVFDRMGNRENRGRARLKFIAQSMGAEAFRQRVLAERETIEAAEAGRLPDLSEPRVSAGGPPLEPASLPGWPSALRQRQEGLVALPARVPLGDLSSMQLRALAEAAEESGAEVRLTPAQGIVLADVPMAKGEWTARFLRDRGFRSGQAVSLVRCAGTDTCTVGITRVRGLAALLEEEILSSDRTAHRRGSVSIGISGCPNGCGHHLVKDIGLVGAARNMDGRLAPHYMLHLGGGRRDGAVSFGTPIGRIAARRVPQAVERLLVLLDEEGQDGESAGETFTRLGRDRCAEPLKDLLEEDRMRYREEDFFDLGISSPEPFPAARTGPKPPSG